MMLFLVKDGHGNAKFVFALGVHHAAEHFVTWQMANDVPLGDFIVERVTLQSVDGRDREQLRDALRSGIEGIGTYDETAGWRIRPVEDDRDTTG